MSWVGWLILAVIFLVIENFFPQFIFIWFAISSLVVSFAPYFGIPFSGQLAIFIILGIILLILFRTKLAKKMRAKEHKTNVNALIGQTAYVSEITNGNIRVTVDGLDWKANSDQELHLNDKVTIKDVNGVTLEVERIS